MRKCTRGTKVKIVIPRGERTWFDTASIRIGYTHSKIATLFEKARIFLNAIFLTLCHENLRYVKFIQLKIAVEAYYNTMRR